MDTDRFWYLLSKLKSVEASPEEQLELSQYLSEHPADIELLKMVDIFWNIPFRTKTGSDADGTDEAWSKFQKRILQEAVQGSPAPVGVIGIRRITKFLMKASAVFLIIFTGYYLWKEFNLSKPAQKNTVSTKNGSRSKIDMPDGTQIWLNGGTRIEYDENYGKQNREITLNGEAYFDVVHNERSPFIIHTKKLNIKVLGTVFNVKAYPEDSMTEASLVKGRIEVTFPDRPQEKLILKPSEKIAVANNPFEYSKNSTGVKEKRKSTNPEIVFSALNYQVRDSTIVETAWVKNKLIFRSKKFDELSREMERWYGITIQVQDSAILNERFTGTFNNESLDKALDALMLSYPFQYKYEKNNTIIIYKK